MYWNERDHPVAHFHAYHAGRRASVSADGDVLVGDLEPRALQFVREWAVLRHDDILANWERARAPTIAASSRRPIAPLRDLLERDLRLAVTTLEIGKGELVATRTS